MQSSDEEAAGVGGGGHEASPPFIHVHKEGGPGWGQILAEGSVRPSWAAAAARGRRRRRKLTAKVELFRIGHHGILLHRHKFDAHSLHIHSLLPDPRCEVSSKEKRSLEDIIVFSLKGAKSEVSADRYHSKKATVRLTSWGAERQRNWMSRQSSRGQFAY